jgi:hypothetical protein
MQRLDLDFRRIRPTLPWARWLLFAIAVGLVADLGVSYVDIRESITRKEERLAKLARPADGPPGARSRNISAEEIAVAREIILRLSMPWDNLFGALESTPTDKVALLAIEPDAKSGTVVISGEGEDYPAALGYASELGRAKYLSHVHLIKHELHQADPRRPVAFSISATWREAK